MEASKCVSTIQPFLFILFPFLCALTGCRCHLIPWPRTSWRRLVRTERFLLRSTLQRHHMGSEKSST
jgi:hypothetical protein